MASVALHCVLPGRLFSWTRLREVHSLVKQQIRSCSSVNYTRPADPVPASTAASPKETDWSSASGDKEWKVLAQDFLRKLSKQPHVNLEDKYVPLKSSKSKSEATKVSLCWGYFFKEKNIKIYVGVCLYLTVALSLSLCLCICVYYFLN